MGRLRHTNTYVTTNLKVSIIIMVLNIYNTYNDLWISHLLTHDSPLSLYLFIHMGGFRPRAEGFETLSAFLNLSIDRSTDL